MDKGREDSSPNRTEKFRGAREVGRRSDQDEGSQLPPARPSHTCRSHRRPLQRSSVYWVQQLRGLYINNIQNPTAPCLTLTKIRKTHSKWSLKKDPQPVLVLPREADWGLGGLGGAKSSAQAASPGGSVASKYVGAGLWLGICEKPERIRGRKPSMWRAILVPGEGMECKASPHNLGRKPSPQPLAPPFIPWGCAGQGGRLTGELLLQLPDQSCCLLLLLCLLKSLALELWWRWQVGH